jgi:hypothetical protein
MSLNFDHEFSEFASLAREHGFTESEISEMKDGLIQLVMDAFVEMKEDLKK